MDTAASNKTMIAVGALTALAGAVPLLAMAGVLQQAQHAPADPAPSWMGWLIGSMFVGAGLIAVARGICSGANASDGSLAPDAPWLLRALNDVLGCAIAFGLAALFSWVAFGPGPRHFSIGVGGLFFAGPGSGDIAGRVAFGFGAALAWFIAAAMLWASLRRRRRARPDTTNSIAG